MDEPAAGQPPVPRPPQPRPPQPRPPLPAGRFMVRELPPKGAWRIFVLALAREEIRAACDHRLAQLALPPDEPGTPGPDAARRRRLEQAILADTQDRAAQDAVGLLIRRLGLRPEGAPRIEVVQGLPDHDLLLQIGIPVAPEITPPDPATLVLERLVARPGTAELAREIGAMAGTGPVWVEQPAGTPARRGDMVVCDVAATLEPQRNRIPQPALDDARPGPLAGDAAPPPGSLPGSHTGSLPATWFFGDNGAGLAAEVLAVATTADPPHVRLRVQGTAPSDGQSYVMFHDSQAIQAEPGSTWAGSLSLRPVGAPTGLRGGKLRIYSQPADGGRTLQRKDSALAGAIVAATAPGDFGRVYVANTFGAPDTALLLMTVLFDHAAGPVAFTVDLAAPRLVEGLDLDQSVAVPVPRLSGAGQRFELRAAVDPLGLAPQLEGIRAGEVRDAVVRLADGLGDRALVGRRARLVLRASAVLRRAPHTADAALARSLGFDGAEALEAEAMARAIRRSATQSETVLRARLRAALLEAAADVALPEPAIVAELTAIWPRLVAAAGAPPPPAEARAAALRSLRLRLVVEALARRLNIPDAVPESETPEEKLARRAALQARVLARVIARARVTERAVTPAELAAAARAAR